MTAVRKGLLWWFDRPTNPYVSLSGTIDFTPARQYLESINRDAEVTVSVQHLVCAVVTRVMVEFPAANSRIIAGRIRQQKHVGVGMPVNLLSHSAGQRRELSAAILDRTELRSLRDIASTTRKTVREEREGRVVNPFASVILKLADATPYELLTLLFAGFERAARFEWFADWLYRQVPFTTLVTNAGAPLALPEGLLFRAAAMEIPQRVVHVGTVWGVSTVQQEVFAINGVPEVRPGLPLVMTFDHRLFDGVIAGRIMIRVGEIMRNPAEIFGDDGTRCIAEGATVRPVR